MIFSFFFPDHSYSPINAPISNRLVRRAVESCFEQAKDFVPERWYSKPEMIKDKRAFAPFAQGIISFPPSAL